MKLLYLTQYFPPEVGAGAVRSDAMVRYLSDDGWEIDVLTEIPNYPTGKIQPNYRKYWFYREKYIDNVWVHRVWVWANRRRSLIQQFQFFLSFMISCFFYALIHPRKYDLIYVTSPPIFAAISGCLLSKIFGAPFVMEIRDLWPDSVVDDHTLQSQSMFVRIGHKIERWLYNQADMLIPVTHESEQIIKAKSKQAKTTVIPNGVDISLFNKKEKPEEGIDEQFDGEKFRVGYVGSLGVIHDLHTFVQAAKLCENDPDIEFIIVGDGGQNNQLHKIIEEIQPSNLQWVGLKKHQQIPYYISSFDLAINPVNDSKAFRSIVTVKFYEYLACETPVLSAANGALKDIGDLSNAAVTIPAGDPRLLADKIKYLKWHPDKLKNLSQNARRFVESHYSRRDLAKKLSDLLKNILKP